MDSRFKFIFRAKFIRDRNMAMQMSAVVVTTLIPKS